MRLRLDTLLTAFLIYVQQCFRPLQLVSQVYTQTQSAPAGIEVRDVGSVATVR